MFGNKRAMMEMINKYRINIVCSVIVLLFSSCSGSNNSPQLPIGPDINYSISATGTIEHPELTTYMYGTNTLVDSSGNVIYALQSNSITLDNYDGMNVTVKGELVSGYPIEGGPNLLNVHRVE